MQDVREHIVENLKRNYPKNLSDEDYHKVANEAVDQILALGAPSSASKYEFIWASFSRRDFIRNKRKSC